RKELLEASVQYLERFARRREGDPRLRNELADSYFRIAFMTNIVGPQVNALPAYERALALYRELHKPGHRATDRRLLTARTLINMSNLQKACGRRAEADASLRESRRVLEELGRERPEEPAVLKSLAGALSNEANRLQDQGKHDEALKLSLRARALFEKM